MMMEMRGDGKEETEEESERPAIFSRSGREICCDNPWKGFHNL